MKKYIFKILEILKIIFCYELGKYVSGFIFK